MQPKGREPFYIFKGLLKEKGEETEKEEGGEEERGLEYVTEPKCNLQNLKYLPSVPLQKRFIDPRLNKENLFLSFLQQIAKMAPVPHHSLCHVPIQCPPTLTLTPCLANGMLTKQG